MTAEDRAEAAEAKNLHRTAQSHSSDRSFLSSTSPCDAPVLPQVARKFTLPQIRIESPLYSLFISVAAFRSCTFAFITATFPTFLCFCGNRTPALFSLPAHPRQHAQFPHDQHVDVYGLLVPRQPDRPVAPFGACPVPFDVQDHVFFMFQPPAVPHRDQ